MFGGVLGGVSDVATGFSDKAYGLEHDKAFQAAIAEAEAHFHRCAECANYFCDRYWNAEAGLCLDDAPSAEVEIESAYAQGKVYAVGEMAALHGIHEGKHMDVNACSQLVCPACGTEAKGAKSCPECGQKLATKTFCTECGAVVPEGAKFCPECGYSQGTDGGRVIDSRFIAFAGLALMLVLTPGANLMLVTRSTLGGGPRAGIATALGEGAAGRSKPSRARRPTCATRSPLHGDRAASCSTASCAT